jgi:hypothetical protein
MASQGLENEETSESEFSVKACVSMIASWEGFGSQ